MTETKKLTGRNAEVVERAMDKIIALMEAGKMNWNKPWSAGTMPQNYVSKKAYRGWNVFTTMFSGFTSPYYLTFNQVNKLGGKIIKGSKGLPITFWQRCTRKDKNGEEKTFLIMRDYTVFNAEQIEGIDFKAVPLNQLGTCEELEAALFNLTEPVEIKHMTSDRAFYMPMLDSITMPLKGQFVTTEKYYSTLIHEVMHSTGHQKRLNRPSLVGAAGKHSENYAYDELVAELGAAFMCAMYGLSNDATEKHSAAYLQGWIRAFKNDKQMLYNAARDAQKAIDYIHKVDANKALPEGEETAAEGSEIEAAA